MDHSPIEFYFDFSSPYGYFASTQIEALAAEFGRQVSWRPILLGPIFRRVGAPPLVEVPLKGPYALRDFARTARLFDIPYIHPARFPIATVGAARAMLWIAAHHGQDKAAEFAHKVFHAFFAGQQDISNTDVVAALGEGVGLPPGELLQGMNEPAIKEALKKQVEDAITRGVFGSPYLIIDDEPFWGFDRFDHIRRWMRLRGR